MQEDREFVLMVDGQQMMTLLNAVQDGIAYARKFDEGLDDPIGEGLISNYDDMWNFLCKAREEHETAYNSINLDDLSAAIRDKVLVAVDIACLANDCPSILDTDLPEFFRGLDSLSEKLFLRCEQKGEQS